MGDRVAVVTDSTAYLPAQRAAARGVRVVPLQVVVNGQAFDEGTPEATDALLAALRAREPVTTSRPSPDAFARTYDALRREGADSVVSIHLSGAMSATVEAAELAAADADLEVMVLDSRSIGMALGFAVLAACDVAEGGGSAAAVADAARGCAGRTEAFFVVDSLDQLRRGGRIGGAQALLGQALSVKPLLRLGDGAIQPWERVRTTARALARLEEVAVETAGDRMVDVAVHHLAEPARAESLGERLGAGIPGVREVVVSEVGAVVGAHTGLGMLAVAVAPAGPDVS